MPLVLRYQGFIFSLQPLRLKTYVLQFVYQFSTHDYHQLHNDWDLEYLIDSKVMRQSEWFYVSSRKNLIGFFSHYSAAATRFFIAV